MKQTRDTEAQREVIPDAHEPSWKVYAAMWAGCLVVSLIVGLLVSSG